MGPPTPVFTVSVDVWPDPVRTTDAGEKVQVTLAGTPEQLSPTVPVNPLTAPTVTLKVVESIERTVREEGEAETQKVRARSRKRHRLWAATGVIGDG